MQAKILNYQKYYKNKLLKNVEINNLICFPKNPSREIILLTLQGRMIIDKEGKGFNFFGILLIEK